MARTKLVITDKGLNWLSQIKVSDRPVERIRQLAHKTAIEGMAKIYKKYIMAENASLQSNHDLLLSVPGIGHLTAVYLICCTNNFYGKIKQQTAGLLCRG